MIWSVWLTFIVLSFIFINIIIKIDHLYVEKHSSLSFWYYFRIKRTICVFFNKKNVWISSFHFYTLYMDLLCVDTFQFHQMFVISYNHYYLTQSSYFLLCTLHGDHFYLCCFFSMVFLLNKQYL